MSKHSGVSKGMRVFFLLLCPFVFGGCDYPVPSGNASVLERGLSRHLSVAKGDTNMPQGYKKPPVYSADRESQALFRFEASEYLEGVTNDLEEIKFRSEDALRKIKAVADGTVVNGTFYHVSRIGSRVFIRSAPSNFAFVLGYPEFPYFDYQYPDPPILKDRVGMMMYRSDVLDFNATVDAYIEDGKHFIKNCENDYNTIQTIGKELLADIESLEASSLESNSPTY